MLLCLFFDDSIKSKQIVFQIMAQIDRSSQIDESLVMTYEIWSILGIITIEMDRNIIFGYYEQQI